MQKQHSKFDLTDSPNTQVLVRSALCIPVLVGTGLNSRQKVMYLMMIEPIVRGMVNQLSTYTNRQ